MNVDQQVAELQAQQQQQSDTAVEGTLIVVLLTLFVVAAVQYYRLDFNADKLRSCLLLFACMSNRICNRL
jgi:hypothetical protein